MSPLPCLRPLLLLIALTVLSACGNKGDLFRTDPSDDAAEAPQTVAGDARGGESADPAP